MNVSAPSFTSNLLVPGPSVGSTLGTDFKIRSFLNLPKGWHYGKGGPAKADIVSIAREYLSLVLLLGYPETDAFPGAGGEIMVSAYRGNHCVEIIIELDKKFSINHEFDGQERFRESDLSGLQASEVIRNITANIVQEECITSSWFTLGISTTGRAGLTTWLSGHQAMAVVHQSSWKTAVFRQQEVFVHTSIGSTVVLAATPQFSGALMIPLSVPHATSNKSIQTMATNAITKSKVQREKR